MPKTNNQTDGLFAEVNSVFVVVVFYSMEDYNAYDLCLQHHKVKNENLKQMDLCQMNPLMQWTLAAASKCLQSMAHEVSKICYQRPGNRLSIPFIHHSKLFQSRQ